MGIEAFLIPHDMKRTDNREQFSEAFIKSPEFDKPLLLKIARTLDLPVVSGQKRDTIGGVVSGACTKSDKACNTVVSHWIGRNRNYLSLHRGIVRNIPQLNNPAILVTELGTDDWHGPITNREQDPDAVWYIRAFHIPHWEYVEVNSDDTQQKKLERKESIVRWHLFCRIKGNIVSFHWSNFSHNDDKEDTKKLNNAQFPFWQHVPEAQNNIFKKLNFSPDPINLENLIMHQLWSKYRYDTEIEWVDWRLRAESEGLALNASTGGKYTKKSRTREFGKDVIAGIRNLASQISETVKDDLIHERRMNSADSLNHLEELVLETLLKDCGTLSYEFFLESRTGELRVRSHCYFGNKNGGFTQDRFPHLLNYKTYHTDLELLEFLIEHLESMKNDDNNYEQRTWLN